MLELLKGDKHCIGILKLIEDGMLLGKKKSLGKNYVRDLLEFHHIVMDTSKIYDLRNKNRKAVENEVLQ